MPRIRYLKPEFFSDEDLAELPFQTRIAFAGLWCYADKEGRLEDRPKYLKAMIFPYDSVDMEKQLELLTHRKHNNGVPFIQRYESNELKLIQIIKWDKHQRPHHTEKDSIFPPAPPLKIKIKGMGMGMGMGMEKQLNPSAELNNGELTVKDKGSISHCEDKNPHVKEFIDFYYKTFKEFFGDPPLIEGGKDGKIIKALLKSISIEDLKSLLQKFFESEDPFILKSGYTIGVFKSQIQKLRIGEPKDGIDLWLKLKEEQDERKGQKEILSLNEKAQGDIPNKLER